MLRLRSTCCLLPLAAALSPSPAMADASQRVIGSGLYEALNQGDNATAADLLHSAVEALGGRCAAVRQFQLFQVADDNRTLKLACAGQPLYAVTVNSHGHMMLSGGDGHVRPMNPADGPIWTQSVAREGTGPGVRRALMVLGVAGAVLLLAYAVMRWYRHQRSAAISRWRGFSSSDKDALVSESREVFPNIFAHPSGLYIARGRHGKRRLFRTLLLAYLYRSLGIKLGQIR